MMANFYAIYPPTSAGTGGTAVTANQGAPNTVANAWPVEITDGTNVAGVAPASTAAIATQPAEVVALSPNSPLPAGTNALGTVGVTGTVTVTGTVSATQGISPWVVDGTVTADQGGAPWTVTGTGTAGAAAAGVVTVQGIASMTPILVTQSGSGSTQPTNVAQFGGNNVVTGTGASGNGIPRVTVSSDSTLGLVAGSAIIGKVGIDQTTPGTTNNVTVSSVAPVTTTTATFQPEGSLGFASITSAFQTVFTPSAATKILQMRNNTNASISVSFDAGTTTHYVLDTGDATSFDLLANALAMPTTAIQIKYTTGAPTSGSFRVNACH
jgi:hypothetical protein